MKLGHKILGTQMALKNFIDVLSSMPANRVYELAVP